MNLREPQKDAVFHLQAAEVNEAIALVLRCFEKFVAAEYGADGIAEFERYARKLGDRLADGVHRAFVTKADGALSGLIEIRNHDHVSLLFVASEHHGKGIAKNLWRRALSECVRTRPDLKAIDVNSSRFAVPVYERLGFCRTGEYTVKSGIGFVPMAYAVAGR